MGRPPNIVIVLCDDLGFGDVSIHGGLVPTPNIDRLASGGVQLDNYYSPANLCTPSRAGLLTGRYPVRTGLGYEVLQVDDVRGLPPTERTIPELLKPRYASALIGKWHLGTAPQFWPPTRYGFDLFYGIPYSHDMRPLNLFSATHDGSAPQTVPFKLEDLQELFWSRAEQFIEDNQSRPFFLELALSAPHLPNLPPKSLVGTSRFGSYGDVLREIDAVVGKLMGKLDELHLTDRTLVIFTSDNGPWFEGSPGPFRDRKGGAAYDGGIHVPFFASMPGLIAAGTRSDAIVSGIDLLPTICRLTGSQLPSGVELDGLDITDVLKGGRVSPHDVLILFDNEDVVGLRTQRWKLVTAAYYRGSRSGLGKGHYNDYDELYDLLADPSESYSVARDHPEILADLQRRWATAKAKFDPFRRLPEGTRPASYSD
jgi:arylsulfatase A